MNNNLNFPYLLAVHTLCIDAQLHQNELHLLQSLAQNIGVDPTTAAAAELILAQDDNYMSLEFVLAQIAPDQRTHALSLAALAAQFDGTLDRTEQKMLEKIRMQWRISEDLFAPMQEQARIEAQRLIADLKNVGRDNVSTGAKMLNSLEAVVGKTFVDRVVNTLGTESLKARIQDFRVEALLSGPKYDKAIEECRAVGLRDIEVADTCLFATVNALQEIGVKLERKITEINAHIGDKPAHAAREALRSIKDDQADIQRLINSELKELHELQIKKRRAMNFYTIAFMGRSKAGKSTLHAVVTGGGWEQIGVGRQNTTRLNRVYEWHNIRIIDTPGIATPGGEELEKVAESIIDEADLICFVVTNNNQQASEFEFLKQLRNKGKPLLVLLNVKEDLSNPVRLKRFLDKPDQAFSDDKDRLGGHIDRIRRDAAEFYGTSNFPIIPVQLLAAQIAQQQPENEHAESLMKASRLQNFLDSVRLSLLDEGLLRRSQNLLGSTVADIERPLRDLKERASFYLDFSNQFRARAKESAQRLKNAQDDHARQLEQDLNSVFATLQQEVPNFAEDHWDDTESELNSAWSNAIYRFDIEKKLHIAQEKAIEAFSSDITDLLEEVGRELLLNHRLSVSTEGLKEQDSSTLVAQTFKWGSSVAGLVFSVALLNGWNPAGWVLAGVGAAIAVFGLIGSLLESKASKRRKAVAKISSALETQIEKQKNTIADAALRHFKQQCEAGSLAVQDYFRISADGLAFVGQTLELGVESLQQQSDLLNIHFAARILDFAGGSPSEPNYKALMAQIHKVHRKVGEKIDINVSQKMHASEDLTIIESVIQEKITLLKTGD